MSFQPIVLSGGLAGWTFLTTTRDRQQNTFNESTPILRDTEYFSENISKIHNAEELMADRRLLRVALGAFGLDEDISNKYFIQKVLEDGALNEDALANKLSDKRYLAFTKAFGFGDFDIANTQLSDFPREIIQNYQSRQFEVAVGRQDEDMRLALGVERDIGGILKDGPTQDGAWFSVMGTPSLSEVIRVALHLPKSMMALDLDQQLSIFREKSETVFGFGDVASFADTENRDKLVQRYLLHSELDAVSQNTSPFSIALALISGTNN